jgi:hypothetical protein
MTKKWRVWIGCDVLLAPLSIPRGGQRQHSPRSRHVYACAPEAPVKRRLVGRLEEVALTGAEFGAQELRVRFVNSCDAIRYGVDHRRCNATFRPESEVKRFHPSRPRIAKDGRCDAFSQSKPRP